MKNFFYILHLHNVINYFFSKKTQMLFQFYGFSNTNISTSFTLTLYYLCVFQLNLESFNIFYYLNFSGPCMP